MHFAVLIAAATGACAGAVDVSNQARFGTFLQRGAGAPVREGRSSHLARRNPEARDSGNFVAQQKTDEEIGETADVSAETNTSSWGNANCHHVHKYKNNVNQRFINKCKDCRDWCNSDRKKWRSKCEDYGKHCQAVYKEVPCVSGKCLGWANPACEVPMMESPCTKVWEDDSVAAKSNPKEQCFGGSRSSRDEDRTVGTNWPRTTASVLATEVADHLKKCKQSCIDETKCKSILSVMKQECNGADMQSSTPCEQVHYCSRSKTTRADEDDICTPGHPGQSQKICEGGTCCYGYQVWVKGEVEVCTYPNGDIA